MDIKHHALLLRQFMETRMLHKWRRYVVFGINVYDLIEWVDWRSCIITDGRQPLLTG